MRIKKALITLIGIALLIIGGLAGSSIRKQSLIKQEQVSELGTIERFAQQAKLKGERQVAIPAPSVEYPGSAKSYSLDAALAEYSAVIAKPIEEKSQIYDSDEIVTWYKFRIINDLSKRDSPACPNCPIADPPDDLLPLKGNEFVVAREGGSVEIDSIVVNMVSGGFPPLLLGQEYFLLVSRYPSGSAALCGGPIGVFTVTEDGALEPLNKEFHTIKENIRIRFNSSVSSLQEHIARKTVPQ